MAPARIGYGSGVSFINVNRNIIDSKTHRWWEGPNYEGPSDKTVAVVKFETTAGQPIAVYYNYAMHGVAATFFQCEWVGVALSLCGGFRDGGCDRGDI